MFTGLIEALGKVVGVEPTPSGCRLSVATELAETLTAGESVAVNGVCLTVVRAGDGTADADIGPETAEVTTLGRLRRGALVNLERPLRADSRLGGHFVQGHVDGTGLVAAIRPEAECHWLTVAFPGELAPYIVRRGSIAVDGISLTVAVLSGERLDVQIIPFTWEHTNLKTLGVRDPVNIECDMLGKYVARAVELMMSHEGAGES